MKRTVAATVAALCAVALAAQPFVGAVDPEYIEQDGGAELTVRVKDLSAEAGRGMMALVTVSREAPPVRLALPDASALFFRDGGLSAKVVFALATGLAQGDMSEDIEKMEFKDILGDKRKELLLTTALSGPDSGITSLGIYGFSANAGKYVAYGSIDLSSGNSGGGCGPESFRVIEGPTVLNAGTSRTLRIVERSIWYGEYCAKTDETVETILELVDDALLPARRMVLQSSKTLPQGAPIIEEH